MMNKQEMQAFRELFSKYCRQEINKGHCESDGCEFCSVNSAYDDMDLFDFNHDGEVSDLERIIGLAAVLSETNPDVEISVNVGEDEDYESMTHDELEERLDELRAQRGTLECEEPDDLDSEAYEEWEEQCG